MSDHETAPCWRTRLRETFGPTIAGLVGGAFTAILVLSVTAQMCRNSADTYATFPSLTAPPLAVSIEVPRVLILVGAILACGGLLAVGPLAVALVRPRDWWGDLSAGLTAGLVAACTTYLIGVGWVTSLATTVVPCLSDLTFVTKPDTTPAKLAERYPDLESVEPKERGPIMMAKIVSDQVSGTAVGVWSGALLSLLTAGLFGACGTMAVGYLRRRGDHPRQAVWSYIGMTVPTAITLGAFLAWAVSPVLGNLTVTSIRPSLLGLLLLVVASAINLLDAIRRQHLVRRIVVLACWFVLCTQLLRPEMMWIVSLAAILLSTTLLAMLPWREKMPIPSAT